MDNENNTSCEYTQNTCTQNLPSRKIGALDFVFSASGRASRGTFWAQYGLMLVGSIVLWILYIILALMADALAIIGLIGMIGIGIAAMVYGIMLTIRRIHDFGGSGWLYLLLFIPWAGTIIFIVFGCIGSEPTANKYGTEPNVTR